MGFSEKGGKIFGGGKGCFWDAEAVCRSWTGLMLGWLAVLSLVMRVVGSGDLAGGKLGVGGMWINFFGGKLGDVGWEVDFYWRMRAKSEKKRAVKPGKGGRVRFHKAPVPLVTTCCGAFTWINVCKEDGSAGGGTFCLRCGKVGTGLRLLTPAEKQERQEAIAARLTFMLMNSKFKTASFKEKRTRK